MTDQIRVHSDGLGYFSGSVQGRHCPGCDAPTLFVCTGPSWHEDEFVYGWMCTECGYWQREFHYLYPDETDEEVSESSR